MTSVRAWVACGSEDWQVLEEYRGFQLASGGVYEN